MKIVKSKYYKEAKKRGNGAYTMREYSALLVDEVDALNFQGCDVVFEYISQPAFCPKH